MSAGLMNSLIIVSGTVAGVLVIAGSAAYAMARLGLPGTNSVMAYLLIVSSLPIQLFLVPLFFMWTRIGLYDNLFGVIIIYWALYSPFATLLIRSFMLQLPASYEEAARLDGAGELTVLVRVVLPMVWPGFLTAALVSGLAAYNEFVVVVTFVQSNDKMPVATSFFSFQQGYTTNYTLISAAGMIMLAPMLILFLLLQRRFVQGVSSQGLAGG
jgi:raffinose/stachyose/melibiose transport system permease protein